MSIIAIGEMSVIAITGVQRGGQSQCLWCGSSSIDAMGHCLDCYPRHVPCDGDEVLAVLSQHRSDMTPQAYNALLASGDVANARLELWKRSHKQLRQRLALALRRISNLRGVADPDDLPEPTLRRVRLPRGAVK